MHASYKKFSFSPSSPQIPKKRHAGIGVGLDVDSPLSILELIYVKIIKVIRVQALADNRLCIPLAFYRNALALSFFFLLVQNKIVLLGFLFCLQFILNCLQQAGHDGQIMMFLIQTRKSYLGLYLIVS